MTVRRELESRTGQSVSLGAVYTTLERLETKGYLRHQEDGPRYIYSATTSHATARRTALQQYLRVFFGGSRTQLMTALLRHELWTDEELETLRTEIERVRKERKR